jgi:hypothetical protein
MLMGAWRLGGLRLGSRIRGLWMEERKKEAKEEGV